MSQITNRMLWWRNNCLPFLAILTVLWMVMCGQARALPLHNDDSTNTEEEQYQSERNTCKMKQFDMTIEERNCTKRVIKNNYCIGYCNSLFIPQYSQSDIKHCRACLPKQKAFKAIKLDCVRNGRQTTVLYEVNYILSCRCLNIQP